jgi:purine-nucleoside phosphorylase
MPTTPGNLLVTFSREGEAEHFQIYENGDKALKGALIMLMMMDELRVGDHLTVQRRQRT